MFEGIYGMSCVENQVLAILRERRNDIRPLYHNSAVPLRELFFSLVVRGEKPYRFYLVPRIQEELKTLGLISLTLQKSQSADTLREQVRHGRKDAVLVRVTPECTKSVLHARGFREDHYVRAASCGDGFLLYNDIPGAVVSLSDAAFGDILTGDSLQLSVRGDVDGRVKTRLWDNRRFRPEQTEPFSLAEAEWERGRTAERLRDLLGVYKIMRYRMQAYYGQYVDTDFIGQTMPLIEQYYMKAEYWNLRKSAPGNAPEALLEELQHRDAQMMKTLMERLEEKR